jgi:ribonucleoside-diphosphate reductase alpha chain
METQLDTGLPYLAFKDTINRANPNKGSGYIPSVNLCTESFSNVSESESHACDLVSLNLANIENEELGKLTKLAVLILDNSIDIGKPPILSAERHHYKYRVLGVGAMGLADWLVKKGYNYTNNLTEVSLLFEDISYYAYKSSIDLAKTRGSFPAYDKSEYKKSLINCKGRVWYRDNASLPSRWERLFDELAEYGIRNSQLLAIAPNTSSSLIQGCTASILPTFNRVFFDKGEGSFPVAPPFIDEYFWHYEENQRMNQQKIVDLVATIQKWIDTGISMELTFDLAKVEPVDIYRILLSAWKQKVKAIYYIRTVPEDSIESGENFCTTCAN